MKGAWYYSYVSYGEVGADASRMSMSGAARGWIERLPAGAWFRTGAVPGPRHVVRNVLSRLLSAPLPIIGRAARGIYWRQPPPAARRYGELPLLNSEADAVLAPPGACYADFGALSHIGWSTQMPYRTVIAVPYRNLTPPVPPVGPPVAFVERSNERRRSLNWNEANLLEAAKSAGAADFHDWDHALWLLTEANGWMKQGEPIRRQMLLWSAETEPGGRRWPSGGEGDRAFAAVMGRLSDRLPDIVEAP